MKSDKQLGGKIAPWGYPLIFLTVLAGFLSLAKAEKSNYRSYNSLPQVEESSHSRNSYQLAQDQGKDDCFAPHHSEYMSGQYNIEWTYQGVFYQSTLNMNGNSGIMLTNFYNSNTNKPDRVTQDVKIHSCSFGLVLAGYNPRHPNTQRPHPNYYADNLVLRKQPNGDLVSFNCDDGENCLPISVEKIR